MESIAKITSPTAEPSADFTMNANSAHNKIADSSFLGIVSFIIFNFAAMREHDQTPGFNSLHA